MDSSPSDSMTDTKMTETEELSVQESSNAVNMIETSSNDELLDQIQVPPLAPEERIVNAVSCNGGISYTTVTPSELGAVPEEDEEVATSSTPSTVVSFKYLNFRKRKNPYKSLSMHFASNESSSFIHNNNSFI